MPFDFVEREISGVMLIKPKVFEDKRGFFMETYVQEDFKNAEITGNFIQDNHSKSKYGVLRGLHFQRTPYSQAKIVRCINGIIYDVAVDLRRDAPTFGEYETAILSEFNKYQLYIPRGFAHGFLTLSEEADVAYKVDNKYAPDHEGGLLWKDPHLDIPWPIEDPIVSEKDKTWPTWNKLVNDQELF
ncbi:MAG: dTDP-4-dehydrorhamnose 3,5-epimerase [Candidatus Korarchaeota archaeon]|nr:dTDP-4-dehydrorhamnose 3,5-epimerase [Candidatus Korarchaeota archaeon]NIU82515.1 dTDP-4-dehydrorhamnose 3,5-epimerase [Candidatus Thorarchaeota archaeon]NIW13002.1 dTDP-4-dehydrorhamnose 3,5-epimerase [Candidatus Thorarchaeota archaeon]